MLLLKGFKISFLLSLIMAQSQIFSQDLAHHRWQHRLLIIKTDRAKMNLYEQQLKILGGAAEGLKERKLKIYRVKNGQYRVGLKDRTQWQKLRAGGLKRVCRFDSTFEIILIGLDGGVKLRQGRILRIEDLFGIIDAMPLRQSEIGKK